MSKKKISIEILDFKEGNSVRAINVTNGGEYITVSGTPEVSLPSSYGLTLTTQYSGSGTVASPYVITGVTVIDGGYVLIPAWQVMQQINVLNVYAQVPATFVVGLNFGKAMGYLDITDSVDFPLSINYTISDGKNLESRFGDYSKSFDVPATKNNNKIFDNIYDANSVDTTKRLIRKECRISVDSIPFFVGEIEINSSTQNKRPKSYSCTIYGGNFTWASKLKDRALCDLEFEGLAPQEFSYANIKASWTNTSSSASNANPLVYPLVSYGDFFPSGENSAPLNVVTQAHDCDGAVNLGDYTEPIQDWKGWLFVYNMIHEVFRNVGYTIESEFIETDKFKKLISHWNWFKAEESQESIINAFSTECSRINPQVPSSGSTCTGTWQSIAAYSSDVTDFATYTQVSSLINQPWYTILYDTEQADYVNAYDTATGKWTCKQAGAYTFESSANIVLPIEGTGGSFPSSGYTLNLRMWMRIVRKNSAGTILNTHQSTVVNSSNYHAGGINYNTTCGVTTSAAMRWHHSLISPTWNMQVDDTIETQIRIRMGANATMATAYFGLGIGGGSGSSVWNNVESKFKAIIDPTALTIGQEFSVPEMLPCDIKQIDFIKGISHLFNLQFSTDTIRKKVYIEPFNEFYGSVSGAVNWEDKVDYSQGIKDKYEIGLSSEVTFQYKEDNADGYMEFLNKDSMGNPKKTPYFAKYLNLGTEEYKAGDKKFENPIFAATNQTWDNDCLSKDAGIYPPDYDNVQGALIPVLWEEPVTPLVSGFRAETLEKQFTTPPSPIDRPEHGFTFEPRILYYHGNTVNPNGYQPGISGNVGHITRWTRFEDLPNIFPLTSEEQYPRATFVDWEERGGTHPYQMEIGKSSLSFADETYIPPRSGLSEVTVSGLYSLHYENMIEQLKLNPRIRTMNFNLTVTDILNLDFRKLVHADGSIWRINRIIDFAPAKNTTTKVELIQWFIVGAETS